MARIFDSLHGSLRNPLSEIPWQEKNKTHATGSQPEDRQTTVDLFRPRSGAAHREGSHSQFVLVVVGGGTTPSSFIYV